MPVLNWIGKDKVVNHDKELPFRVLKPNRKFSVGDASENLLIEGDNLEALKALMPFYYGKVKCIYIDPPYNTGNEKWVYNDKVNSPQIRDWLNKVVGGQDEDLCRHDKWLSMMYPRLKLLRDLLKEDGLIFISIDDNEVHHLKLILNEIFGEKNFIAQISVQSNPRGRQAEKYFATVHEYILVYGKNKEFSKIHGLDLSEKQLNEYKYVDSDGKRYRLLGLRQRGAESRREDRPNMFFPIYVDPKTKKVSVSKSAVYSEEVLPKKSDKSDSRWMWSKNRVADKKELLEAKLIGSRNEWDIFLRDFLESDNGDEKTSKSKTLWIDKTLNYQLGKTELKAIFGNSVFDYPKPTSLIKYIISLVGDSEGIYLDSFAGSGTTGHAVIDSNDEDGGTRKFILVELEGKIAKEITATRLKKVSQDKKSSQGFQYLDLNGELYDYSGFINPDAQYEDLAAYIYFTETRNYLDISKISNPLIGSQGSTHYYLLYEGKGKNVLDEKTLKKTEGSKGNRVIYADKCLLDDDYLEKHGITFKQIPYELKKY